MMKKASLLLLVLAFQSINLYAVELNDSTRLVLNQPDSVTRKVVHLLFEATQLSPKKPAEALKNYRKALTLNKVKDVRWEADIRLAMGKLLYRLKSKDALPQLIRAEDLYRKKGLLAGRAEALWEIALLQEKNKNLPEALKHFNEVYRIQHKLGEAVLAGNVASHLTDVFTKQQNYKEAFRYADMAKNAYYKVCRADSLGAIYYKIASLKRRMNSPKLAEYYILNHALPYYRSAANLQGRLKSFDFLGSLYVQQKRYSEAKWFYLQANNQARIVADTTATIHSLINLGVTKILIGDIELAKSDIVEAESFIQSDSTYAPIMKRARVKYATLFKKLDTPVIAAHVPSKPQVVPSKPKTAKKAKVAENATEIDRGR